MMLERQRLFTAEYELDSRASPPGMRRYRFDWSLRPDSTFELRTNASHDRPYSTGPWRVKIRSTDTICYNLRLEATQGNVIQLYTLDQQAGSWLGRSAWPVSESIRLRKRRPAER